MPSRDSAIAERAAALQIERAALARRGGGDGVMRHMMLSPGRDTQVVAQEHRNRLDSAGLSRGRPNQGGNRMQTALKGPNSTRLKAMTQLRQARRQRGTLRDLAEMLSNLNISGRKAGGPHRPAARSEPSIVDQLLLAAQGPQAPADDEEAPRSFFGGRKHFNRLAGRFRP